MPYKVIRDLPASVQGALPPHAQEIYLAAFNRAWVKHCDSENREEVCHRIAWSAVKRKYEKKNEGWVMREI